LVYDLLPFECVVCCLDKGTTISIGEERTERVVFLTNTNKNTYYVLGFFFTVIVQSLHDMDLGTPDFMKLLGPFKHNE
jgi:F420-0:gamma-glutamyl ligase-like protein